MPSPCPACKADSLGYEYQDSAMKSKAIVDSSDSIRGPRPIISILSHNLSSRIFSTQWSTLGLPYACWMLDVIVTTSCTIKSWIRYGKREVYVDKSLVRRASAPGISDNQVR